MEPDDGMSWEDGAAESLQAGQARLPAQVIVTSSSSEMSVDEPQAESPQKQVQQRAQERPRGAESGGLSPQLRTQTSRERLTTALDAPTSNSPTAPTKIMDPAQVTETRKVSITPPVARSVDDHSPSRDGPLLPSDIMKRQQEERKRTREEIEALEEAQRKKTAKGPARSAGSSDQKPAPGKLRKERDRGEVSADEDGSKDKKKKTGGVFGGLFGRKKDKGKDKGSTGIDSSSIASAGSAENIGDRNSVESGRSSSQVASNNGASEQPSPVTASARQQQQQAIEQQQQQQQQQQPNNSTDPRRQTNTQQPSQVAGPAAAIQLSQHASQLRQRDQQQQALYQQYLNRSPSSPPEAQPNYGLQSVSAVMPGSSSFTSSASMASGLTAGSRARPGSLVLSPGAMDGQGMGLPDLSVIRVFAGNNLQTEATFKTVLLNSSTTASGLVRQAVQRFRLPGEDISNYYLSIKQAEGSSATLLPNEKPLVVFESLVEAAMELPKVKRSSVGSISSVSSNLSMHPAIKKLPMNDFTDDSAVKFYLNRRGGERDDDEGDEGDETFLAESILDDDGESPRSNNQYLTINTGLTVTVTPERFTSPSYRFALQLAIHPEDLPDDMVFDPLTEAIVFKHTLRDRQSNIVSSPGVSTTQRRKVFYFPKNATVAEVIERGLERFGIIEGVVDGGDEIEDKMTKRRSSTRVRYCLCVDITGKGTYYDPRLSVGLSLMVWYRERIVSY